jgi:hypothetical protein
MNEPTVFISYSHKNKDWKDRLVTHLRVLQNERLFDLWDDRRIAAGEDWHQKITDAMNAASAAVLLITADFLTSKFILEKEVPRLIKRKNHEGLIIFPVIVKPCAWKKVKWLCRMQVRPEDGKPLSSGDDNQIDTHLTSIAEEVAEIARKSKALHLAQETEALPNNSPVENGTITLKNEAVRCEKMPWAMKMVLLVLCFLVALNLFTLKFSQKIGIPGIYTIEVGKPKSFRIEPIIIDSRGEVAHTPYLEPNSQYTIMVDGVFNYNTNRKKGDADAQFQYQEELGQWTQHDWIEIDGRLRKADIQSLESNQHIYYVSGNGARITIRIYDKKYHDNAGSLTAFIYKGQKDLKDLKNPR